MYLSRLVITGFRNIGSSDLRLSDGFNFLIGPNGSGKTAVLEALYMLGHGRSFKTSQTSRIVKDDSDEFCLHGRILSADDKEWSLGLIKKRQAGSEVKLAGQPKPKLAELARLMPLQLIHPEGTDLFTQGPKARRAFIDWGVFHTQVDFFALWASFNRLLKQRNAQLKGVKNYELLRTWDIQLVEVSSKITNWRIDYLASLTQVINQLCQVFLPDFKIEFTFFQGWDKRQSYLDVLSDNFERDWALGYTSRGPNKADFKIQIAGTPVDDVLSRGQLKLLLCAMRIAQGLHLVEQTGKRCIYLIDDFASELDGHNRKRLMDYLKSMQAQVFISSITENQINEMKNERSCVFRIEQGHICPSNEFHGQQRCSLVKGYKS